MQQMDEGRVDNAPYTSEMLKERRQLREDQKKEDQEKVKETVLRPATFIRQTTMGQTTGESGAPNKAPEGDSKPTEVDQERLPDANENQFAGNKVSGKAEAGLAGVPAKSGGSKKD